MATVFDIEGDGLTPTKIHVVSYKDPGQPIKSITDYDEMREFFLSRDTLVGHFITFFDVPSVERLLDIKVEAKLIDTCVLSWYLQYRRIRHGLEAYGEELGFPKVKIDDWENLPLEQYVERCEVDVHINNLLWEDQQQHLKELYRNPKDAEKLVNYLMFKADCVREAERSRWKLDRTLARGSLAKLLWEVRSKRSELRRAMPKVKKYREKTKPKKFFTKKGGVSKLGQEWYALLEEQGLDKDHPGPIQVLARVEEPKPTSPVQVKEWLFSLGWEPETFDYKRNDDGTIRKIPQVQIKGGGVCKSVLKLADKEPAIKVLDGLSVASHRAGVFKGFLENADEEGFLKATCTGFTNTLRLKHQEIVNLPGVGIAWGKEIRGSLIARDGYELLGSDVTSLEDNTKRHYMFEYDPEFVEAMSKPGYDPHLDLAHFAGAITDEQAEGLRQNRINGVKDEHTLDGHNFSKLRKNYKQTNYAATYGVGEHTLSRQSGLPVKEAAALLKAYWRRNWSIKQISDNATVKTVRGQKWVFNDVSGFWYTLKADKDRFSTINQSTGVYVFDCWLREIRKRRPQLTAQFHDEIVLEIKKGNRPAAEKLIRDCMEIVNRKLNLNVTITVDVQFGPSYGHIH